MGLTVRLGERSYRLIIANSYRSLPAQLKGLDLSGTGWVVSHHSLLRRYGGELLGILRRAGWLLNTIPIPESETSKSFGMVRRIVQTLSRTPTLRTPVLFAFGGGVVGDVTGFVAAVFHRGIPYIQLPTTLLAQVDSAIGGKVGVDLPEGKNLLGAFHQPRLVYNSTEILRSLPMRQRRSGLAEVIKYGVIEDAQLFAFLETHLNRCLLLEPRAVRTMLERSCRIKARVVSQDERERKGLRVRLNFGHTLGHALETVSRYQRWTHGEAIAIGMCAAADLSARMDLLPKHDVQRLAHLIKAVGLPTRARGVQPAAVLRAMRYDKKFIHGRPRWVLPTKIGRVLVTEHVPERLLRQVIHDFVG